MSDCRFGVSPVNYPDPDPDPGVFALIIISILDSKTVQTLDEMTYTHLVMTRPIKHDRSLV